MLFAVQPTKKPPSTVKMPAAERVIRGLGHGGAEPIARAPARSGVCSIIGSSVATPLIAPIASPAAIIDGEHGRLDSSDRLTSGSRVRDSQTPQSDEHGRAADQAGERPAVAPVPGLRLGEAEQDRRQAAGEERRAEPVDARLHAHRRLGDEQQRQEAADRGDREDEPEHRAHAVVVAR